MTRRCVTRAVAMTLLTVTTAVVEAASWKGSGSMSAGRWGHNATLVPPGRVLVFGYAGRPELWDPRSGFFLATGQQTGGGYTQGSSATLLANGRVLVVSGTMAEIYDWATGTFTATRRPVHFHLYHTATALSDGRVLVAGGQGANGAEQRNAELYDPATGAFTPTGSLQIGRSGHAAVALADGRVVIVGGSVEVTPGYVRSLASMEIYDPASERFLLRASLSQPAGQPQATLLLDGTILVSEEETEAVDLYDPRSGLVTPIRRPAPLIGRAGFSATRLQDGRVLLAGGYRSSSVPTAAAELYWPEQRAFTPTASMTTARQSHTATLLGNGQVLVTGGWSGTSAIARSELYRPSVDTPPPAEPPLLSLPLGGRIAGVVRDASTSLPLAGVLVTIQPMAGGSASTFGKTNSAGRYISDAALPIGLYYARTANAAGYIDEAYRETVCAGCPSGTGQPITVGVGATTLGIDFTLDRGARVTGVVRDSAGAPVSFAQVQLYDSVGRRVTGANADFTGAYVSEAGLPTGTYFARASSFGYLDQLWSGITCQGCSVTTGTPILAQAPDRVPGIDFELSPAP